MPTATRTQIRRAAQAKAARRAALVNRALDAAVVMPLLYVVVGVFMLVLIGGGVAPLVNAGNLPLSTLMGTVGVLTFFVSAVIAWNIGDDF